MNNILEKLCELHYQIRTIISIATKCPYLNVWQMQDLVRIKYVQSVQVSMCYSLQYYYTKQKKIFTVGTSVIPLLEIDLT